MTKQESIKYISSLINNPSTVTEGDRSSIALFRQRFPYFVPMRYLLALEDHKKQAWSPAMQSAMQPYMGNWMLFCQMLEDGSGQTDADAATLEPSEFVYQEETNVETEQEAGQVTDEAAEYEVWPPEEHEPAEEMYAEAATEPANESIETTATDAYTYNAANRQDEEFDEEEVAVSDEDELDEVDAEKRNTRSRRGGA